MIWGNAASWDCRLIEDHLTLEVESHCWFMKDCQFCRENLNRPWTQNLHVRAEDIGVLGCESLQGLDGGKLLSPRHFDALDAPRLSLEQSSLAV